MGKAFETSKTQTRFFVHHFISRCKIDKWDRHTCIDGQIVLRPPSQPCSQANILKFIKYTWDLGASHLQSAIQTSKVSILLNWRGSAIPMYFLSLTSIGGGTRWGLRPSFPRWKVGWLCRMSLHEGRGYFANFPLLFPILVILCSKQVSVAESGWRRRGPFCWYDIQDSK